MAITNMIINNCQKQSNLTIISWINHLNLVWIGDFEVKTGQEFEHFNTVHWKFELKCSWIEKNTIAISSKLITFFSLICLGQPHTHLLAVNQSIVLHLSDIYQDYRAIPFFVMEKRKGADSCSTILFFLSLSWPDTVVWVFIVILGLVVSYWQNYWIKKKENSLRKEK